MVVTLEDGSEQYVTGGGITVTKSKFPTDYVGAIEAYVDKLNSRRGAVFSSNYEYPGRYTRWDTAIANPPLVITARGRDVVIEALNERGDTILPWVKAVLRETADLTVASIEGRKLAITVDEPGRQFTEEERSRVPSVFTVLRSIVALFFSELDSSLGLYGAFGYDLCFQFDPIKFKLQRPDDQRDLVLFLPDEVLVVDHYSAKAWHERYEFELGGKSTMGLPRETPDAPFVPSTVDPGRGDHRPGEYADLVKKAMESFRRGDLFEVVPGQTFYERCETKPSEISRRLKVINPSPYSFFINLGNREYLIGASPEMFVRVNGRRIETCPISGTIKRGDDAISD